MAIRNPFKTHMKSKMFNENWTHIPAEQRHDYPARLVRNWGSAHEGAEWYVWTGSNGVDIDSVQQKAEIDRLRAALEYNATRGPQKNDLHNTLLDIARTAVAHDATLLNEIQRYDFLESEKTCENGYGNTCPGCWQCDDDE